jgi:polyisoprenoid-binding protein YceI
LGITRNRGDGVAGEAGARMAAETLMTAQYSIDAAKSRFTVTAYASGLLSGLGHNPVIAIRDFTGQINFAAEELSKSSLEFLVQAESLTVQSDVSDKDRSEIERTMKGNVLETGRYPEVVFASTEVSGTRLGDSLYALKIQGLLSLHGVTRTQSLVTQMVPGEDSLRAYGEFTLRQTDFNIKLVSVAGGALKVKDELKLSFDMTARKQA